MLDFGNVNAQFRRNIPDDILTTINFQVRDLDLQAMGSGGDGTEKDFGPIPIISSDHI